MLLIGKKCSDITTIYSHEEDLPLPDLLEPGCSSPQEETPPDSPVRGRRNGSYGTILSVRKTWFVQQLRFLRFSQVEDLFAELGVMVMSCLRWYGCITLWYLQWYRPSWLWRGDSLRDFAGGCWWHWATMAQMNSSNSALGDQQHGNSCLAV